MAAILDIPASGGLVSSRLGANGETTSLEVSSFLVSCLDDQQKEVSEPGNVIPKLSHIEPFFGVLCTNP